MEDAMADVGKRTALVMGTDQNLIGWSIATELVRAGYFVFCGVRDSSKGTIKPQAGMACVVVDETSTASVTSMVLSVSAATNGKLDVLVNSVGFSTHLPVSDADIDNEIMPMFNENVLGVMRMVKGCLRLLINAKGSIINIGSVSPLVPLPFSAPYNATKAALYAYGDGLEMELEPFGVQVLTVVKGNVESNLVRNADSDLPHESLYYPIREHWKRRVNIDKVGAMSSQSFAQGVVQNLRRTSLPSRYWRGGSIMLARLTYILVPRWLRQKYISIRFGLSKLKGYERERP